MLAPLPIHSFGGHKRLHDARRARLLLGHVSGGMLQHFQIANAMDGKAVQQKEPVQTFS